MFLYTDQLSLTLSSGAGGSGCVSFYRTRTNPRGGPDGGDGGAGGSVVFVSSPKLSDFEHLKKFKAYKAEKGKPGGKQKKKGAKGKDLILNLPLGALVRNPKGQILKDMATAKPELFLEGGIGGRGNSFFKTSLNQAPRQFQQGGKSQSQKVILELKPLIHIAIIGKVNAGKSSFFNLAAKAKSKTADYPYTTLIPHIGQVKHISKPCLIMDIPGLEKGSSGHVSKGLAFLRLIQRAKILLHFIDSSRPDPLSDKKEIEEELKAFDKRRGETSFKKLSSKKMFFVLAKTDRLKSPAEQAGLIRRFKLEKNQKAFPLSNKTGEGLKHILSALAEEI